MTQIDYFFAPMSPFTYLAGARLEAVAARHVASIRYIPIDAPALFPRTGGQTLAERHESRKAYRLQELRRGAKKQGVPILMPAPYFPVNPAPASYAIIAAAKAGGGDLAGLVQAFPRAVWAEGRNIAEDEVVKDILGAHGFDPGVADRYMLAAAETYANNLEEAVSRGVFGVPFYIVGDETFWGQDRLDDLDLYLAGKL
ncbi:2-hydroxychromene-2-carboxylate isomerase [Tabrizicola sp. BL-A-41-H6]|uniref:2-hydroxychromene-2-carboxylate isomerase n=1 Tax=Tabrizicola sp. BL-A-41-H6 TaxID=3421107 RepID=UPI003D66C7EF